MNEAEKLLSTIDPIELGKKLRLAREKRGLTQQEAADIINAKRTTMVAIEKGERRIRPEELVQLVMEYGQDLSYFVQASRYDAEFSEPQFRGPEKFEDEEDKKIEHWIETLKDLATDFYECEQLLKAPLIKKYPPEYEIGKLKASEIAESIALEERQRLGLGDRPIPVLRDLLEQEVGLRIYYLPLIPSKYSAIYVYSEKIGGCIAINSNHPEERRRASLAHDYGHFLTSRYKPAVYIDSFVYKSEIEKIADQFFVHFMMPASGVTRRFNDIRKSTGKVTPYDLVSMAHYFGVSFDAMCYRLEELRLIPSGMLDNLKEQGFKVRDVRNKLGLGDIPASQQRLSQRHQLLAIEALESGLISEGHFADLFDVNRLEAREIFAVLSGVEFTADDAD